MPSEVAYKTWNILYAKRTTFNSEGNFIWYLIIFVLSDTFFRNFYQIKIIKNLTFTILIKKKFPWKVMIK